MSTDLKATSPLADEIACLALLLLLLVAADMPLLANSFILVVVAIVLPLAPSLTTLLTQPPTMFKQIWLMEQASAPSTHPQLTKQRQRGSRKSYVTCYNIRSW